MLWCSFKNFLHGVKNCLFFFNSFTYKRCAVALKSEKEDENNNMKAVVDDSAAENHVEGVPAA